MSVSRGLGAGLILAVLCAQGTRAQTPPARPHLQRPWCRQLRRQIRWAATPRGGACLDFSTPHAKGENEIAAQYLSTALGQPASKLAHQLFVVLDARLPARLTQVSDSPEGARSNPLKPNEEVVGADYRRATAQSTSLSSEWADRTRSQSGCFLPRR